MKTRIHIVTLGVSDMARARRFYEALGFKVSTASAGDFVIFALEGAALALYPRHLLTEDSRSRDQGGFGGVTLAQNTTSEAEVDAALKVALAAGATLLKPAQKAEWGGYSGYFADPDGHPWEVAFNPFFEFGADGQLKLPR